MGRRGNGCTNTPKKWYHSRSIAFVGTRTTLTTGFKAVLFGTTSRSGLLETEKATKSPFVILMSYNFSAA
jgi:hypothetical protein